MSLEVDNRPADVPIPYQREDEGFIYLNQPSTDWAQGQNPHGIQVHEKQLNDQQSKPTSRLSGRNTAETSRFMVFWSVLFCLVSVLAIVAAGVTGSIAARRGRNLNSWLVFFPQAGLKSTNANSLISV